MIGRGSTVRAKTNVAKVRIEAAVPVRTGPVGETAVIESANGSKTRASIRGGRVTAAGKRGRADDCSAREGTWIQPQALRRPVKILHVWISSNSLELADYARSDITGFDYSVLPNFRLDAEIPRDCVWTVEVR